MDPRLLFVTLFVALVIMVFLSRQLSNSRALQVATFERLSVTDSLTGLYNRRGHELLAAQVIHFAARSQTMVAILFLDLDGLKRVNDEQGHGAGDRLLLSAANLLRRTFRTSDVIARMGGDEFCVVGADAGAAIDRDMIPSRLEQSLASHNATNPNEPPLSLSIGSAWWDPRDPKPLDELVRAADERMYASKRSKCGRSVP